ncbi:hypothetical protein ASG66_06810 [Bacillus sp. Leaf406]|nr:hypothetical protein ASG66_06810 [Bacillus sp. Leaf406]
MMAKKSKVSIKINGEKKTFDEDLPVHDWKGAEEEIASAEEKVDDKDFEWVLPEGDFQPPKEYKKINYVSGKNKKRKSFRNPFQDSINLLMSLVGAIVVGAVLGFGTLKVITATESDAAPAALQEKPVAQEETTASKVAAVEVDGLKTSILQGGVFSKEEALVSMKETLATKGIPGAQIEKDGQWILILGVSNDLTSARALGEEVKKLGVDVYAKDFELSAKGINATKGEQSFLEKGGSLFQELTKASSAAVVSGKMEAGSVKAIETAAKEVEGIKVEQEGFVSMKKSLQEASAKAAAISSAEDAREVQGELLKYVEQYGGL